MAGSRANAKKEETKPEDFVEYFQGYAIITLSRPLEIGGAPLTALKMREPCVNDNLTYDEMKGTDARKEVSTLANLLEMDPAHVAKLPLRDYVRMQAAYAGFLD